MRQKLEAGSREDLMSVLGHELRSPLTAIRGAASLLRMPGVELAPAKVAELLAVIDGQAGLMADRIEDILAASRLDHGDLRVLEEEVELGDVVADVLDAARVRFRGRRIRAPGPVDGIAVAGDQQRVAQVLRILVANAAAHSPASGPVEVRVRESGDGIQVDVRDRGPGVEPGDRERVFERGVKLDPAGPGAGLGLYVARGLVHAMRGSIGVEPRAGGGSDFWFRLPLPGK